MRKICIIFLICFTAYCSQAKTISNPNSTAYAAIWLKQTPAIFDLSLLPEVVLWLDATDASTITVNGFQEVSEWRDKTAIPYDFISPDPLLAPEYNGTINGLPAVDFGNQGPAEEDWMRTDSSPYPAGTPNTDSVLFIVAVSDSITERGTLFSIGTGGDRWLTHAPWLSGAVIFDAGPVASAPYRLARADFTVVGEPWMLTLESSVIAQRQQIVKDGNILARDNDAVAVNTTSGRLNLAAPSGNSAQDVKVGEVVLWQGFCSRINRQTIEGYLAWKWGLQDKLPYSHIFKYFPPSSPYPPPFVPACYNMPYNPAQNICSDGIDGDYLEVENGIFNNEPTYFNAPRQLYLWYNIVPACWVISSNVGDPEFDWVASDCTGSAVNPPASAAFECNGISVEEVLFLCP